MQIADQYERYMLTLINQERAKAGAAPLKLEQNLNVAAEAHSEWMLNRDIFSHTGVSGSSPSNRIKQAGFDLSGSWRTAENIAVQSERGASGIRDDTADLHRSLMNSPGHRANILNPDLKYIGIGIELGDFRFDTREYESVIVTQNFATTGGRVDLDRGAVAAPDPVTPTPTPTPTQTPTATPTQPDPTPTPQAAPSDIANGTNRNDKLNGDSGDNHINGRGGNDVLLGRNGDDQLSGDAGRDTLTGGNGNDTLLGGRDNDRLRGDNNDDLLDGGYGNDLLYGGNGQDQLDGGFGNDYLNGGAGNDLLEGGRGNDRLDGSRDDDVLLGGHGNDRVLGGFGDDTLDGGTGADFMVGGRGADKFVFSKGHDKDFIRDFQDNVDTLDLSSFNFRNPDQALSFASQSRKDLIFDFGAGDVLTLKNTTISTIQDDLMI